MPIINISLYEGKSPEFKKKISDAIHAAMTEVLHVPLDTYDHFFFDKAKSDMVFDRNYFGIERTEGMIFIQFFFNARPPALKAKFFDRVAHEITTRVPSHRQEDLLMCIVEVAPENWWAYGRTIDPVTGFDTRMKDGGQV